MIKRRGHLCRSPGRAAQTQARDCGVRGLGRRWGAMQRDEPVFLSSRLLISTSKEPSSESHLSRSWCSCPTSPSTVAPIPSQRKRAHMFAPLYRVISRDDPVFLSSRLLIYTSMEPTSQSHLSRSCFSCPTSPPTVDPIPSHRNRAPVLAPLYRVIGRDDPVCLSFHLLAFASMEPTSDFHLTLMVLMVLMLQMPALPTAPFPQIDFNVQILKLT